MELLFAFVVSLPGFLCLLRGMMREYSGREVLICAWVGSGISVLGCGQRRLQNWEQGAGTGEAGAAGIGLDAEAGSEKHRWMPRCRL